MPTRLGPAWTTRSGVSSVFTISMQFGISSRIFCMSSSTRGSAFVQHTAQSAPALLLLECRRGGNPGLTVEPPLLLYLPDGSESPDVRRAYFRDKE